MLTSVRKKPSIRILLSLLLALFITANFFITYRSHEEQLSNADGNKQDYKISTLSYYNATLDEAINNEQKKRSTLLNDICNVYYGNSKPLQNDAAILEALLKSRVHMVNEKYKILVCLNYKAGTTNLLNYLIQISESLTESYVYNRSQVNKVHSPRFHTDHLKWLLHYDRDDAIKILNDSSYTRVIFVRDPLQRIVSSWKDKLTKSLDFYKTKSARNEMKNLGLDIIETTGGNASSVKDSEIYPITLEDLFKYITIFEDSPALINHHWRPYLHNCFPCRFRYNFIGHMENLGPELEFLARKVTGKMTVPKVPIPSDRYQNQNDELRRLPKELVRKALKRFYFMDYAIFGYDLPAYLHENV